MEYVRAIFALFDMHGERIVLIMLIIAVIYLAKWVHFSNKKHIEEIKRLEKKYRTLDKLIIYHAVVIRIKLGIRTVKIHRTGDYEILNPIDMIDD